MNNHDLRARSVAQAVNEEGDGMVQPMSAEQLAAARAQLDAAPVPLEGRQLQPMSEGESQHVLSEADRLAAAQAERLKKREELKTAAPAMPQAEAQAAPKVVAELHVKILDSGKVEVLGPINDPSLFLDVVHQALIVLFNHTVITVQKTAEAKAKVPFMQRIFQKRARPATPGQA